MDVILTLFLRILTPGSLGMVKVNVDTGQRHVLPKLLLGVSFCHPCAEICQALCTLSDGGAPAGTQCCCDQPGEGVCSTSGQ